MRKLFRSKDKTTATDVVSVAVLPHEVDTDDRSYSRLGWLIVIIGVGGFIAWASIAPLDKGVPVPSTVTVSTNRKAIQHQTGGTVEEVMVKEGDVVTAGQPLVRMNDVMVKSQAEATRGQYFTARAAEARLTAERDGKSVITISPELKAEMDDPRIAGIISLQNQLFFSRQLAIRSELSGMEESMSGLKMQTRGLEESRDSKKQQLKFLNEQLVGMRDLAKEGYVARNRLLDFERTYSQINGSISEDIGNIGRSQRQITEIGQRKVQRQQEYQKEVRSQLSDIQREADALHNRLLNQDFDLSNVVIHAPVDGSVVGLTVYTKGAVIGPGYKVMDIVPSDDPLIVEGQVPTNLIDKVHVGLPVEMMFAAFNANTTPHIPGVVTQISADRLVDEKTGMPYYKMRAKATPEGKKILAALNVRPGMPVEVFVKTGERTMMSYLFKPVVDRAKTSLSEE